MNKRLPCRPVVVMAALAGVLLGAHPLFAQAESAEPIVPRTGLLLQQTGRGEIDRSRDARRGRDRFDDPLADLIVRQGLRDYHPAAGQELQGASGNTHVWRQIELDENGSVAGSSSRGRGGHLYIPIPSQRQRVMILEASGHSMAYFNGQPRVGNIYGYAYVDLPVLLDQGVNHLLLRSGRGSLAARLYAPSADVFVQDGDMTLPDLIVGQPTDTWGAAVVINATQQPARGLSITASGPLLSETTTALPEIPPLGFRKVGFRVRGPAPTEQGQFKGTLELRHPDQRAAVHAAAMDLSVTNAESPQRRTFVSDIDGSVQYYALRPAVPLSSEDPAPAIVISCHGAGVEAIGQAGAYATKSWLHLVAPTNRRPYGFDWEDYGRLDALEVLQIAKQNLPHEPSRIYLTGHSMGGHGAWHLGVTHPDLFAAVGPSAGWISRATYGQPRGEQDTEPSEIDRLVARGGNVGDTIGLAENLQHQGVYILHGADDDNVPASQARRMAEVLGQNHRDWVYHEEPGKGHWWGNDFGDGGTACVDWPFMFDFFARHALQPVHAVTHVVFTTANPGVSSRCQWVQIEGQIRHEDFSRVDIHTWPNMRRFAGTTSNVAVLRLDTRHLRSREPLTIQLDGQTIENVGYPEQDHAVWLRRDGDRWQVVPRPPLSHKGPHRYGPIKNEMRHRFLFVYGTAGSDEENGWSKAKARYDCETFWYRGNGSVDVVADVDFSPTGFADRSVVLYGHAESNSAWPLLLKDSPIQVRRGEVAVGERRIAGEDLSAIFVRPRPDSDIASVAVVSGTGPVGMRLADQVSFFTPFVRYPDCLVTRAAPVDGAASARSETLVAGYFGLDWSLAAGEFLWAP